MSHPNIFDTYSKIKCWQGFSLYKESGHIVFLWYSSAMMVQWMTGILLLVIAHERCLHRFRIRWLTGCIFLVLVALSQKRRRHCTLKELYILNESTGFVPLRVSLLYQILPKGESLAYSLPSCSPRCFFLTLASFSWSVHQFDHTVVQSRSLLTPSSMILTCNESYMQVISEGRLRTMIQEPFGCIVKVK